MSITLITTIIPTYRRSNYLKRAIESVLAQSFNNFQIYVYDNASGDETESVVADYIRQDDRVFYVKNNQNIGGLNNMIKGVNAVSTPFYSLLNDDDFLLPDFYEKAIIEFERCPRAGFVCAKTITVDVEAKKMQFRNRDWLPGIYEATSHSAIKMHASHFTSTGVLFRENMRQLIGAFECSGNDVMYLTMAAAASPFVVLDIYGAVYTVHLKSYSAMSGITGRDVPFLHNSLLSGVDNIMNINLPSESKVYLLALLTNEHFGALEYKQLQRLKINNYANNSTTDMVLPSRITYIGATIKLFYILPRVLYKLITNILSLIRGFRNIINSRYLVNDWINLSEDANCCFVKLDSDISSFLSCVRAVKDGLNNPS